MRTVTFVFEIHNSEKASVLWNQDNPDLGVKLIACGEGNYIEKMDDALEMYYLAFEGESFKEAVNSYISPTGAHDTIEEAKKEGSKSGYDDYIIYNAVGNVVYDTKNTKS